MRKITKAEDFDPASAQALLSALREEFQSVGEALADAEIHVPVSHLAGEALLKDNNKTGKDSFLLQMRILLLEEKTGDPLAGKSAEILARYLRRAYTPVQRKVALRWQEQAFAALSRQDANDLLRCFQKYGQLDPLIAAGELRENTAIPAAVLRSMKNHPEPAGHKPRPLYGELTKKYLALSIRARNIANLVRDELDGSEKDRLAQLRYKVYGGILSTTIDGIIHGHFEEADLTDAYDVLTHSLAIDPGSTADIRVGHQKIVGDVFEEKSELEKWFFINALDGDGKLQTVLKGIGEGAYVLPADFVNAIRAFQNGLHTVDSAETSPDQIASRNRLLPSEIIRVECEEVIQDMGRAGEANKALLAERSRTPGLALSRQQKQRQTFLLSKAEELILRQLAAAYSEDPDGSLDDSILLYNKYRTEVPAAAVPRMRRTMFEGYKALSSAEKETLLAALDRHGHLEKLRTLQGNEAIAIHPLVFRDMQDFRKSRDTSPAFSDREKMDALRAELQIYKSAYEKSLHMLEQKVGEGREVSDASIMAVNANNIRALETTVKIVIHGEKTGDATIVDQCRDLIESVNGEYADFRSAMDKIIVEEAFSGFTVNQLNSLFAGMARFNLLAPFIFKGRINISPETGEKVFYPDPGENGGLSPATTTDQMFRYRNKLIPPNVRKAFSLWMKKDVSIVGVPEVQPGAGELDRIKASFIQAREINDDAEGDKANLSPEHKIVVEKMMAESVIAHFTKMVSEAFALQEFKGRVGIRYDEGKDCFFVEIPGAQDTAFTVREEFGRIAEIVRLDQASPAPALPSELDDLRHRIAGNPDSFGSLVEELAASQPLTDAKMTETSERASALSELPVRLVIRSYREGDAGLGEDARRCVDLITAPCEAGGGKSFKTAEYFIFFKRLWKKETQDFLTALQAHGQLDRLLDYYASPENTLPADFAKDMIKFSVSRPDQIPEKSKLQLMRESQDARVAKVNAEANIDTSRYSAKKYNAFRVSIKEQLFAIDLAAFRILIEAHRAGDPHAAEAAAGLSDKYSQIQSGKKLADSRVVYWQAYRKLGKEERGQFLEALHAHGQLERLVAHDARDLIVAPPAMLEQMSEWLANLKKPDFIVKAEADIREAEQDPGLFNIAVDEDAARDSQARKIELLVAAELNRKGYDPEDFRVGSGPDETGLYLADRGLQAYPHPETGEEIRIVVVENEGRPGLEKIDIPDRRGSIIFRLPPVWAELGLPDITPDFVKMSASGRADGWLKGNFDYITPSVATVLPETAREANALLSGVDIFAVENLLPDGSAGINGVRSSRPREFSDDAGLPQPRLLWNLKALNEDGFTVDDVNIFHNKWLGNRDHTYVVIQAMKGDRCFQTAVCVRYTDDFQALLEQKRWDKLLSEAGHNTYVMRESIDWETQKLKISDLRDRDDVWTAECYTEAQYIASLRAKWYTPLTGEGRLLPQLKKNMGWGGPVIATQTLQTVRAFYDATGQIYRTSDETVIEHGPLSGMTTPRRLFDALYAGAIEGLENIKTQKDLLTEALTRPGLPAWPMIDQKPAAEIVELKGAFEDAVLYMLIRHELPSNPELTAALTEGRVAGREELGISADIRLDKDFYVACGLGAKTGNDNYEPAPVAVIRQFARLLG